MKHRRRPLWLLVFAGVAAASLATAFRFQPTRWEYTMVYENRLPRNHNLKAVFDSLGSDGWELVAMTVEKDFGFASAYFKRPR